MQSPEQKGTLAQSLLQVNNLTYKLPPSLSIATKRVLRNDFFQQNSYASGGEIMVLDCQSGNMFVDPHRSFLRFDVKTLGAQGAFGAGSGANLFSRIIVRTRSGAEITRLETANLITIFKNRYEKPLDWFSTIGEAQGYGELAKSTGQGTCCAIRLSDLIPCFDPEGGVLLPPQMMQGLRIEIETASSALALIGASVTSFQINNPRIQFCNVQLGDAFARRIAEISASQGLSVIHREIFHTQVSSSANGQTAYNFDIKKACSKALKCIVLSRSAAAPAANTDSLISTPWDYNSYQSRVGELYHPQAPMSVTGLSAAATNANVNRVAEAYQYTTQNWTLPGQANGVTLPAFGDGGTAAICFNYTTAGPLSGLSVNNSRAIVLDLQMDSAVNGVSYARRLDAYLQYLRLSTYFISNATVKD